MKLLNFNEFVDSMNESNFVLITESFNSSILQRLSKNSKGGIGKKFFDALSKMGIAVSEITNLDILEIKPEVAQKWATANPKDILIYYSTKEKENPYAGRDAWRTNTISADIVLGVVKGKSMLGLQYDKWASKGGKAEYKIVQDGDKNDSIGVSKQGGVYGAGITTISRIAKLSDVVYVINPDIVASSKETRDERKESRQGAIAFIDDKQFKAENLSRYNAILKDRASNDDIDKIVFDSIDKLSDQIKSAIESGAKGQYGDILIGLNPKGREVKMSDAGNLMSNILRDYGYYASAKNDADTSRERHGEIDTYYTNRVKEYAKTIKDHSKKIDTKNYAW
jgi:hypothetical protein